MGETYADAGQINAVVPFKTGASGPFTRVSVNNGSEAIGTYELPVTAAVPGISGTNISGTVFGAKGDFVAAARNEVGSAAL